LENRCPEMKRPSERQKRGHGNGTRHLVGEGTSGTIYRTINKNTLLERKIISGKEGGLKQLFKKKRKGDAKERGDPRIALFATWPKIQERVEEGANKKDRGGSKPPTKRKCTGLAAPGGGLEGGRKNRKYCTRRCQSGKGKANHIL